MRRGGEGFLRSAALCALLLLPAWTFHACVLRIEKEREPNDTIGSAQALTSGKTVRASMGRVGDVDVFSIAPGRTGSKQLLASVELVEKGAFDLELKIIAGGKVVKVVNDTAGEGEKVMNVLLGTRGGGEPTGPEPGEPGPGEQDPEAENVLFMVETVGQPPASEAEGPTNRGAQPFLYELSVKTLEREPNEEGEPNDKMVDANQVDPKLAVKGFFSPGSDRLNERGTEEDWFTFSLQESEGGVHHMSHSAVPGVDSVIAVYDELGYLVRESNSRGIGETEKLRNIGLPPGEYYVMLASAAPHQRNTEVGYLLRIERDLGGNRESEPNDMYPAANPLAYFQDAVGNINPAGDIDWFSLSVFEPGRRVLTVRVSPTAEVDPVLELYDHSEKLLLKVDDRQRDEGEIIKNIGIEQGVYYLKLYDRSATAENPDRDYTLVAEETVWREEEEYEKNDLFEEAETLPLGGLKKGYVSPRNDRDVFSFQLDKASRVTVEATPVPLLDLGVNVYTQFGELLEGINENPGEEGERRRISLPAGKYYIEIYSVNEKENSRDVYILRVNRG